MPVLVSEPSTRNDRPPAASATTRAPLGFEGGDVNLYRYVRNSPTNTTDPFGLAPSRNGPAPVPPPPPRQKAPPARDPKDIIALVRMLDSNMFQVRQQASAKLETLLGKPPDTDVVDILEFNEAVQKIRKDSLEANQRVDRLLDSVPYRRSRIVALVKNLTSAEKCTVDTAERELASLLGMLNHPKVVAYVEKVLNKDQTIAKLRKDNADLNKKVTDLIKYKGIQDDIPLPKEHRVNSRQRLVTPTCSEGENSRDRRACLSHILDRGRPPAIPSAFWHPCRIANSPGSIPWR